MEAESSGIEGRSQGRRKGEKKKGKRKKVGGGGGEGRARERRGREERERGRKEEMEREESQQERKDTELWAPDSGPGLRPRPVGCSATSSRQGPPRTASSIPRAPWALSPASAPAARRLAASLGRGRISLAVFS